MSEKLCVFCKNLDFGSTEMYESGGGYPCMSCEAGHFREAIYSADVEFRREIRRAETCPDYDEAKP